MTVWRPARSVPDGSWATKVSFQRELSFSAGERVDMPPAGVAPRLREKLLGLLKIDSFSLAIWLQCLFSCRQIRKFIGGATENKELI